MTLRTPLIVAVFAAGAWPQDRPVFDSASVKPSSGPSRDFRLYPGGRLRITSLDLGLIFQQAFGIKRYQLTGGPAWLYTDTLDIDAKAEGDPSQDRMLAMLQSLLAGRFQLKIRRESREENVYALTIGKNGPKLTPSAAAESYVRLYRNTPRELPGVDYTIAGQKASLPLLAERLGEMQLNRPVLDRTGLKGEYDFKLRYATDDNLDTGPSISNAIQEQLGLKLEAAKGPRDLVEKAERLAGN